MMGLCSEGRQEWGMKEKIELSDGREHAKGNEGQSVALLMNYTRY